MRMFLKLAAIFWFLAIPARVEGQANEILDRLSELRLDRSEIYSIRDVTVRRDAISLSFERGAIAFLEPVEGRVTGAVFVGSGDVLVIPPDEVERRQINRFTGSPILNQKFDAAIIRFTDDTYEEILRALARRAAEDVRSDELEALLPWDQNIGSISTSQNFRILRDLVGSAERPFFSGALREPEHGWFNVAYDETQSEEVVVSAVGAGQAPGLPDIWASFNRRSEARDPKAAAFAFRPLVDVLQYEIDTTIDANARLSVRAEVRFRSNFSGERAVEFNLSPSLRVRGVRAGRDLLAFFQPEFDPENPAAGGAGDLVVLLPRPTVAGEEWSLAFEYEGPVLARRGQRTYYAAEQRSWYPDTGRRDAATYDLTFHHPAGTTLIATGRLSEEADTSGVVHSRWISGRDLFAAGFDYGNFESGSDDTGSIPIDVYINNDVAALGQELLDEADGPGEAGVRSLLVAARDAGGAVPDVGAPPEAQLFSIGSLGQNILGEVRRTVAFLAEKFGPYPFDRLKVSQVPVEFGQGWPSVVHVQTMSFFDAGQRERLGFGGDPQNDEFRRTYEIAHQWFGHQVGWESYHDRWMVEGLAAYAAILYLDAKYPDSGLAANMFEAFRRRLQAPTGEDSTGLPRTYDDAGPIWLGYRLMSSSIPDGYAEVVQTKAPWVFHMLRQLMRDPSAPDSNEDRFFTMLREFLDEFDGRAATTADFKSVAERHMTDRMDLSGDGTLDWFFDAWVYESGLPGYEADYTIEESGGGFVVSGRVTPEGAGHAMPVPVYARTGDGSRTYLGDVVVEGGGTELFFFSDERPVEVLLDPDDTILKSLAP